MAWGPPDQVGQFNGRGHRRCGQHGHAVCTADRHPGCIHPAVSIGGNRHTDYPPQAIFTLANNPGRPAAQEGAIDDVIRARPTENRRIEVSDRCGSPAAGGRYNRYGNIWVRGSAGSASVAAGAAGAAAVMSATTVCADWVWICATSWVGAGVSDTTRRLKPGQTALQQ